VYRRKPLLIFIDRAPTWPQDDEVGEAHSKITKKTKVLPEQAIVAAPRIVASDRN
jgi:hypothetical protein